MLSKLADLGWIVLGLLLDKRQRDAARKAEKKAAQIEARRKKLENLRDS